MSNLEFLQCVFDSRDGWITEIPELDFSDERLMDCAPREFQGMPERGDKCLSTKFISSRYSSAVNFHQNSEGNLTSCLAQ
jgi:hypothetical protein